MLAVLHTADVPANKKGLFEGKCDRLSMQVKINTDAGIWLRRLFTEIAHILG
jgi:hypothetical protein